LSRIAYVNGRYLPYAHASVHIEDRGYQFADGVYEVCEVRGGKLVDERRHMERLARSLHEIKITSPMTAKALGVVMRETIERNRVHDGLLYLQVTRGVAKREHVFPAAETRPSVVITARAKDRAKGEATARAGIAVITVPESRWDRVDVKTIGLLPNVLARQRAREQGAGEAWFVDRDGFVTEGSSSNAWIVTRDKKIVTRPAEHGILRGITRTVVVEVAKKHGFAIEERPFTVKEALAASEAFVTAATQIVMPVVKIDGHAVGNAEPGPVTNALRAHFYEIAEIDG
jgi:D-alanine transaminase